MNDLAKITNHRSGEIKFGEKMITYQKNRCYVFSTNSEAKYVIVGIQDIGIRANLERPGQLQHGKLQLKYCQHTA
jgi:formiminoglutamase